MRKSQSVPGRTAQHCSAMSGLAFIGQNQPVAPLQNIGDRAARNFVPRLDNAPWLDSPNPVLFSHSDDQRLDLGRRYAVSPVHADSADQRKCCLAGGARKACERCPAIELSCKSAWTARPQSGTTFIAGPEHGREQAKAFSTLVRRGFERDWQRPFRPMPRPGSSIDSSTRRGLRQKTESYEVTITAEGVYWHPVGVEDADLLVTHDIFALSEAFAAVRRAFERGGEHANKLARIFNCA